MIKISAADRWFSLCCRERSEWKCDRCGTYYPEGKRMALHCSHYVGRGNHAVRYDPENVQALCYGCHQHMSANPAKHEALIRERLGEYRYAALLERAQNVAKGREARREKEAIAEHYRHEYRRMVDLRASGETGRIEFVGWY